MCVVNARVEHGDDHLFAAFGLFPSLLGIDVRTRFAAILAAVKERPLIVKVRVVRRIHRSFIAAFGNWQEIREFRLDTEIRLRIIDQVSHCSVLSRDRFGICVVEVIYRFKSADIFDAVVDPVIETPR